jgi:adenosine deaminase
VRFSPDWAFHGHGVDWDACLDELLKAKQRAEDEFDMVVGIVAITSRGMGAESCVKTVDWAIRHREHVLAVDLADGELLYPMSDFVKPMLKAKDAGLKITVHSGEDTPASAVVGTIHAFQPDRIGHGIHIIEDMKAVELVMERGITLEVNPWSNYLTNSVPTIEEHPLKKLFDLGVRVTINSDDPEVLETNLNNEYRIAHEVLGMSMEDIAACNRFAYQASFIPEETKKRVKKYFAK